MRRDHKHRSSPRVHARPHLWPRTGTGRRDHRHGYGRKRPAYWLCEPADVSPPLVSLEGQPSPSLWDLATTPHLPFSSP
jgi:hypothetical protein